MQLGIGFIVIGVILVLLLGLGMPSFVELKKTCLDFLVDKEFDYYSKPKRIFIFSVNWVFNSILIIFIPVSWFIIWPLFVGVGIYFEL